ncbi:MAG: hypothetical protein QM718_13045 [Steroidobacteraceae bacterium]
MRNLFLGLLVLNLLFFGWARWIDAPADGGSGAGAAPALRLAKEAGKGADPLASKSETQRCYSVGPYADEAAINRVQGLFTSRAAKTLVRKVENDGVRYWVYLPAVAQITEQHRQLRVLQAAGISDAEVLTQPEYAGRISLGLFRDKDKADARTAAVTQLGLQPQTDTREAQDSDYWLDVTLPASAAAPQTSEPELANGGTLQVTPCAAPT